MNGFFNVIKLLWNHGNKYVYVVSVLALLELGYLYGSALMDGNIDQKESSAIKAASERVVESLP